MAQRNAVVLSDEEFATLDPLEVLQVKGKRGRQPNPAKIRATSFYISRADRLHGEMADGNSERINALFVAWKKPDETDTYQNRVTVLKRAGREISRQFKLAGLGKLVCKPVLSESGEPVKMSLILKR